MRALRRLPLLVCLAATFSLTGCVALLGAETPEQKFYAAQGMYVIAVEEAVTYSRRVDASPEVMRMIRAADAEAYQALVAGRAIIMLPSSSDRDQRLVLYANIAQAAIGRLIAALEEESLQ